jgi:hypothetical protein
MYLTQKLPPLICYSETATTAIIDLEFNQDLTVNFDLQYLDVDVVGLDKKLTV